MMLKIIHAPQGKFTNFTWLDKSVTRRTEHSECPP